jgi:hypothetical protein
VTLTLHWLQYPYIWRKNIRYIVSKLWALGGPVWRVWPTRPQVKSDFCTVGRWFVTVNTVKMLTVLGNSDWHDSLPACIKLLEYLTHKNSESLYPDDVFLRGAKAVPLHVTQALGGGGRGIYLLLILDLGARCGWVVSVTPRRALAPVKDPWYPLYRRLGGFIREVN